MTSVASSCFAQVDALARPTSCISRLVAWAIERPGTLNWYVTQNYKSAKQIAWRQLKIMVPPEMFVKKNESELSVELTNGSVHSVERC